MGKNQEYKNAALAALKGSWPQSIVATFVVLVLSQLSVLIVWGIPRLCDSANCSQTIILSVVTLVAMLFMYVLVMPCMVGAINAFNALFYRSDNAVLSNMRDLTFAGYFRNAAGMFLMNLIVSVCSLALIVPGMIASLSLFLVPYLLHEHPELSLVDIMCLSRKMMHGHKMRLFKLALGFLGWELLNIFTLGIGTLWLVPYAMTATSAFYQDVREQYIMKEGLQESAS